mmetsp:Transcript_1036/g.2174  ORF Transcript_1036/g.2174 Transcript_1036/m.2174 type:complete len:132 (+) Transcript_1036:972-1367(+)
MRCGEEWIVWVRCDEEVESERDKKERVGGVKTDISGGERQGGEEGKRMEGGGYLLPLPSTLYLSFTFSFFLYLLFYSYFCCFRPLIVFEHFFGGGGLVTFVVLFSPFYFVTPFLFLLCLHSVECKHPCREK